MYKINPVAEKERIEIIDILRGIAILGILLINIYGFGMEDYSDEKYKNNPHSINFWIYKFIFVLFDGKMRGLFGILSGVGILLFIKNKSKNKYIWIVYFLRMIWLVIFGLFHSHVLLWSGDILYLYGICGIILYFFKNIEPKYLILFVLLLPFYEFYSNTKYTISLREKRLAYNDALKLKVEKKALNKEQNQAINDWLDIEKSLLPDRATAKENTIKMKSDYNTVSKYIRAMSWDRQTIYLQFDIWDSLALMVLGFVLYKIGFITGNYSATFYKKTCIIAYVLGLSMSVYYSYFVYKTFGTLETNLKRLEAVKIEWIAIIYPFQRIFLVIAHISLVIILIKNRYLTRFFRKLANVGRLSLTNYIMQTIICTFFFYGYGLNYYGELEYNELFLVVIIIWVIQFYLSSLWLKYYVYGPLEWLWRSLTYFKIFNIKRKEDFNSLNENN